VFVELRAGHGVEGFDVDLNLALQHVVELVARRALFHDHFVRAVFFQRHLLYQLVDFFYF